MAASVEQVRSRRLVPGPQDREHSVQPPQEDHKEQAPDTDNSVVGLESGVVILIGWRTNLLSRANTSLSVQQFLL